MITLQQAVIVEGKYDKIKLESILDAVILTTDGFGVFKDREKQRLIRRLARERGIVVLTDSDSAGFVIRSFLSGIVPPEQITNVYIPDIFGKEKRKAAPSKEGKLGVEGIDTAQILEALNKAGVLCTETNTPPAARRQVTKTDFYEDGLSGKPDSAARRKALLKALDLPERLSANAMLKMINTFLSYDDYKRAVQKIQNTEEK
ncbi:MAG: toprim domain-containing protein [Candidatus Fimenecus sp.]